MAALSLSELNALRQSAVVILAQQSAMRAVRRRIQKEGRIKGPLPLSTLSRVASRSSAASGRGRRFAHCCRTYKTRRPAQLKLSGPPLSWPNPNPDSGIGLRSM